MKKIYAIPGKSLSLGRLGENERTQIVFPVTEWLEEYPNANIVLFNRRPNETQEYPIVITGPENGEVFWTVEATELAIAGDGYCMLEILEDGVVAKSANWRTKIHDALTGANNPPDPWENLMDDMAELVGEAQDAAQDAEDAKEAIEDMGVSASTLSAGSDATVTKTVDPLTGEVTLEFGIPKGDKGDTGEAGQDGSTPVITGSKSGGTTTIYSDGVSIATILDGQDGADGQDGQDGVSPAVSVETITGGHEVTITDADGEHTFDVMDGTDGQDGQDGADGQDGFSPTVTVETITGGHEVTITDANGDHTFDVMDGEDSGVTDYDDLDNRPQIAGVTLTGNKSLDDIGVHNVPAGGTTGQVLKKVSGTDYDVTWSNESGGGGTGDYTDLTNKPQINSVTLSGNKSLADLGIAASGDIPDVSGKADKVSSATDNNFAALDANGNLKDSGHKHGDYLTQHQDISGKADKTDTVLTTTLSRGRHSAGTVGTGSFAFGNNVVASGYYSHAEGSCSATGDYSHAEGAASVAGGEASHSEGSGSFATGDYSHAEGFGTNASGLDSHTEGQSTEAYGFASHAEGVETSATGTASHVFGFNNIQDSYANWDEWVSGETYSKGDKVKVTKNGIASGYIAKKNNPSGNPSTDEIQSDWFWCQGIMNYVEIVGNGFLDDEPSNARTLDWDGNEKLAGDLTAFAGTNNEISISELKNAISAKYTKPSGGIPASDIASGVIPSVPAAYTSNPAALGTASPGSSGSWARGDHVHAKPSAADIGAIAAPSSPATGAFLVYNGSAWVAQTLSTWQGGNY